MFSLIILTTGVVISFVYPLYRTYGLLSEDKGSARNGPQMAKQIVENLSGILNVPKVRMDQLEECIAYWAIVSICYFIGSFKVVAFAQGIVPFGSLLMLYLKAWLVFPIVPAPVSEGNTKVTGTYIIYHYYLYQWLADLTWAYPGTNATDFGSGTKNNSSSSLASSATVDGFDMVTDLVNDKNYILSESTSGSQSMNEEFRNSFMKSRRKSYGTLNKAKDKAKDIDQSDGGNRKSSWSFGFSSRHANQPVN
ncbi:hypothetical protein FOA43_001351 [Brettanomyces nanus]|uniref:Uncharacterized protein n=1 Tax=Eeniella nana TaxID=13502 RepID=A0A875S1Q8_EENNA|nr:uncharacterized protein FOA43_001351 [Brettanomyces nanus]QPG74032.1 hypothetical protein FOA43_001351 [Brettanomyces nanus]